MRGSKSIGQLLLPPGLAVNGRKKHKLNLNMETTPFAPPLPPDRKMPRPQIETESPFLAKLASALENYLENLQAELDRNPPEPERYSPKYYFFYGTLRQPEVLTRILELQQPPKYRPARIWGWPLSNWGPYRTLLDGPAGNIVEGDAYVVQSQEDEDKLAHYETSAYKVTPCSIEFTDDQVPLKALGKTFMYSGDAEALRGGNFRSCAMGTSDGHEISFAQSQ
ncbi:hypothetical protein EV356DRAFT_54070 [Viridothelium virens]|uniref:Putative gamma-glutamylcyclotransferase n=1 Tax=Viridothelium virens TaxID=1048519 RepID=A0A6A6HFJ1_VIRVR|nr:hypothetical protein EV356DRAFT_54070 [Viridothelium virens]